MRDGLDAALRHALADLNWRAGVSRAALLARFPERSELGTLLRRRLPDGLYFSAADVIASLTPERPPQTTAPLERERPAHGLAASQEPFDGVTPEGLGPAIRAAAGELAAGDRGAGRLGAALRSAALPGWGQLHNGQAGKAAAFAAACVALVLLSSLPRRANGGVKRFAAAMRPCWLALLAATYAASLADAVVSAVGVPR